MSDWWARIETAEDGIHLYPLPDIPADLPPLEQVIAYEDRSALIAELRERHGIPADWMAHPERGAPTMRMPDGKMSRPQGRGWDVAVISGPPHRQLLEMATVHEEAEDGVES